MKTYTIELSFIEGLYLYTFTETALKNPNNEILFAGRPTKKIHNHRGFKTPCSKMYELLYTENTLNRLNAKLMTAQTEHRKELL